MDARVKTFCVGTSRSNLTATCKLGEPFIFLPRISYFQLRKCREIAKTACMISEHRSDWLGLPVELYDPENTPNYAGKIYRLATSWESEASFSELFERFTENAECAAVKAVIIGAFHGDDSGQSTEEAVQLLVAARRLLPNLRGIFLGDLISEENEMSWIVQSDVTPLFAAYPALEHFVVRGSGELSLGGGLQHAALKSFVIESGGLPASIIRDVAASRFPALEHLELWTGADNYGGDSSIADLQPFLVGDGWPRLNSLGLRNSEYADEIAEALLNAPILAKLDVLDLSLGVLGDRGAEALLNNTGLSRLKKLDLHHHYMSGPVMARVAQQFPFADVADQQKADKYGPYIAVSE
jgi:hypothetical protein